LRLRSLHQKLDRELRSERAQRRPDGLRVVRLKKLKLALKDRIAALSRSRTTPQTA